MNYQAFNFSVFWEFPRNHAGGVLVRMIDIRRQFVLSAKGARSAPDRR